MKCLSSLYYKFFKVKNKPSVVPLNTQIPMPEAKEGDKYGFVWKHSSSCSSTICLDYGSNGRSTIGSIGITSSGDCSSDIRDRRQSVKEGGEGPGQDSKRPHCDGLCYFSMGMEDDGPEYHGCFVTDA